MEVKIFPGGEVFKTHTETVKKTQYVSSYSWGKFEIPLPAGTLGMTTFSVGEGLGNGIQGTRIAGGKLYTNVFVADPGVNITVTATVLVKE